MCGKRIDRAKLGEEQGREEEKKKEKRRREEEGEEKEVDWALCLESGEEEETC